MGNELVVAGTSTAPFSTGRCTIGQEPNLRRIFVARFALPP